LSVIRPTTVVSLGNIMMVFEPCLAMQGTEHAPLREPRVEDQCGICVVTYPYHLGAVR
jgi:hypothetical protein